ncbi:MAG: hypothetical protein H6733_07255 [Alphaproteobacteria bacterium]|nr:hypothetical protein [Alphaproteobacteria bacterium]
MRGTSGWRRWGRFVAVVGVLALAVSTTSDAAAKGGKKGKGKPSKAAAAPALPAPPPVVSPLDGELRRLPLIGPDDALDIETMIRSKVTFDLSLDNTWLHEVDDRVARAMRDTLAADPRWRVTEEDGVVLALRRDEDVGIWSVPRTGFHATPQDAWRIAVRFAPWSDASGWATSPSVVRMAPDDAKVHVKAFGVEKQPWYGRRAIALSADGDHLGFDIYELGSGRDVTRTVAALEEITDEVWRVIAVADGVASMGAAVMPLPAGEPAKATSLTIDSPGPALLSVRARVNPGVAGWTWVRLVAGATPWAEAEVGAGTRERVGWSADPTQGFYLQGAFVAPAGPAFDATAEVWVQPDDGSGVRKVASFPVHVPER